MINIKDLTICFGERKLLNNVTTVFPSQKLTAIIGRNGTGKSTMIKALCGLNDHYSGDILIEGENIRKIPKNKIASTIAYVNTQRPRIANLKCKDVVALGRSPYTGWHGKLSDEDIKKISKSMELVGMSEYANRNFNSLSDGESQKIMIARAIAQDTPIIILDEPTSFLDLPTRYELVNLLKQLTKEGKTIIFSTHELDIALKLSDNIAMLEDSKIINLPVEDMKDFIINQHHPFGNFF